MKPEISVILPTWNPGAYLLEAISSIAAQTIFNQCELIVVNDGSTETRFLDMARKGWGKNSGIRFVTAPHGGLSSARNYGIGLARGEYIVFCDDDDAYHPGALERMLDAAQKMDADMVRGRMTDIHTALSSEGRVSTMTGHDASLRALHQTGGFHNSAWAALYRRDLFTADRIFPIGKLYEDLALIPLVTLACGKVAFLDAPIYYYRQRPGSILHTFDGRRLDVLDITEGHERTFAGDAALLHAARDRTFSAACNILSLYMRHNRGLSKNARRDDHVVCRCLILIRERRREVLWGKGIRLKNRLGAIAAYLPSLLLRILK